MYSALTWIYNSSAAAGKAMCS